MKKTKIVATIGPSSDSKEKLEKMIDAGMDVARLNFSHETPEVHGERLNRIRSINSETAVMMDTQGPEVRLGEVGEDTILEPGNTVILTPEDIVGDSRRLPVDYPGLMKHLEEGDTILLSDGQLELRVERMSDVAECRVIFGGRIISRKSVNIPGKDIGLSAPTEDDIHALNFGIDMGFDFVAASFVKSGEDVRKIKGIINNKKSPMKIIAKIEHLKAIQNLDEILAVTDAIMIARGDLGVEVPASDVPMLQKNIIKDCSRLEKPVIVATQMLTSMTEKPRATRAEVSDVANAVEDGADAVMLSEETAIGKYPVKTIQFMSEILEKMEGYLSGNIPFTTKDIKNNVADIIARSVWQAEKDIKVKYIIAHTSSGFTARKIARLKPCADILAFTDSESVLRQLNLTWGVRPFITRFARHADQMMCNTAKFLYEEGYAGMEDVLIMTAGEPVSVPGSTNMMEIRSVKSLLTEGDRKGNN